MATFMVTTRRDVVNPQDGLLSLREALARADATPAAPDTIRFNLDAMGGNRIVLAGSELTASSDVTINGGSGVVIDANEGSRVISVGGSTSLANLTITGGLTTGGGESGGGILSTGHLSLAECTVSHNRTSGPGAFGGGIHAASAEITATTIQNNITEYSADGGGIFADGNVNITSSFIDSNTADGVGGGVATLDSNALMFITDSTISNNLAGRGGGIFSYGYKSVTNSTIARNSVAADPNGEGGGIFNGFGGLLVSNCTISENYTPGEPNNGGGILSYVQFEIENSIVAGNLSRRSPSGYNPLPSDVSTPGLYSNGHNIFGTDVEGSAPGDLENVPVSRLFAGGLADNGGPTPTIALRNAADNPALAGADPADAPATDQRGVSRPQPAGTAPDIGAFELDQATDAINVVLGTNRSEVLLGTSGADLMRGFGGNDTLRGFADGDRLFGGAGNDVLYGNGGLDRLQGDGGADRFVLRLLADAPAQGPVYDEVLDFSRAQNDRVDVSPLDAKAGVTGNQAFVFIGDSDFSAVGQLRYEATSDGDWLVSGNVDRDLDADFALIVRTDLTNLRATDFVL